MTDIAIAAAATAATAVIADDERLMREQLRARLAEAWPQLRIVAEARNGLEAVQAVAAHRPDIVFLDIRMPGLDGIEAARQIGQLELPDDALLPQVVFITAYDEHAVQAFEEGAADYVLKPAQPERLARTVARLQARLRATAAASTAAATDVLAPAMPAPAAGHAAPDPGTTPASPDATARDGPAGPHGADPVSLQRLLWRLAQAGAGGRVPAPRLTWIQASVGPTIQMIPVDDVLFFVSDEKYTRVQTAAAEALIRKPIKDLLDGLDPDRFWQIHRSAVVNVAAIESVTRDERGRQVVAIKGHPQRLEVSRSHAGLFKGM